MESILPENPELIIKTEFEDIYSDEDEESSPLHPQIIINQALNVNGVPTHFICIKNVKFTKDAIIIDVVCDIEKNEDAEACQKTQKVLDSRKLKKKYPSENDPLNHESAQDEKNILISYNLKQEPIVDDSYALKDFEKIGNSNIDKSNDLFTQEKTQVKPRTNFFKCPECDKRCKNLRHLNVHQTKIHEKLKTKKVYKAVPVLLQCGLCDQKFENETVLNLHMKSDHSMPHQRVLPAPKQNIGVEKSPEKMYFECKECCQKFTASRKLTDHLKKDHGKNITYQEIRCDSCNKIFNTPQLLKSHNQRIHEGRKDYQCDICSKQFFDKQTFNRHQRHVHEKVKRERNHICNFCGLRCIKSSDLKHHIAVVHEGLLPYECKTCGKSFSNVNARSVHVQKVHEGGTKQICKICSKDCLRPKA